MSSIDDQLQSIRRMWTYRVFVWGLRVIMAGALLVVVSAIGVSAIGTWAGAVMFAGLVLSVPFCIQAYTKFDMPYMVLFRQALHEALGEQVRPPIGLQTQASGDGQPPQWLVSLATTPVFGFIAGMVMTMPMSVRASTRLRIAGGRVTLRLLKDAFNPTFY